MNDDLPFITLLYRYFFFDWLFQELGKGDLFERAAAMRRNREQARWLPIYVLRWMWWGLAFYSLAGLAELVLEAPGLAAWFYAASAVGVAFALMAATSWIGLTRRQEPL